MRSMVEGACRKDCPMEQPPSVRPPACHLPVPGGIRSALFRRADLIHIIPVTLRFHIPQRHEAQRGRVDAVA